MNEQPTLRYVRVRKVCPLVRANAGDAGLDFFFPEDLTFDQLMKVQAEQVLNTFGIQITANGKNWNIGSGEPCPFEGNEIIEKVTIHPQSRILIPSGIKVLLTPRNSMLMAANKSGISTRTGLVFGAEIVDAPYTGEVHISLINTSCSSVTLTAGEKMVQFIHVPIYDTDPEEISAPLYKQLAKSWGTRGEKGFGSSDKPDAVQPELPLDYEDELAIRDAHYSNY